ncbi:MAG: DNA cytosine methyltransferase [Streptosporangiaceae bacterium]
MRTERHSPTGHHHTEPAKSVKARSLQRSHTRTGYGGLDIAALAVFGGSLAWCADNDKHVSTILAARYPDVANLGDLTTLDWAEVPTVDILCAGFPCQDISTFPGESSCCDQASTTCRGKITQWSRSSTIRALRWLWARSGLSTGRAVSR